MYAKKLTPEFVNEVIEELKKVYAAIDKAIRKSHPDACENIKRELYEVLEAGIHEQKRRVLYFDSARLVQWYITWFNGSYEYELLDDDEMHEKVGRILLKFISNLHEMSKIEV